MQITLCPPGYAWGYSVQGSAEHIRDFETDTEHVTTPVNVLRLMRVKKTRMAFFVENNMARVARGET